MQKPILSILLFVGMILLSACGGTELPNADESVSPHTFVTSLVEAIKAKDEAKIWEHFIHEEELREMLKLQGTPADALDKQVEDMWSAMQEDKGDQSRVFDRGSFSNWSNIGLDSVRLAFIKNKAQDGKAVPETKVAGMGTLHVYLHQGNEQEIMLLPCLKMKSGAIRMVSYPRFKKPEPPKPKPLPQDSLTPMPDSWK